MGEKSQITEDGQLEFVFPDEQEGRGKHVTVPDEKKPEETKAKPDVEIIDDTPAKDRGRKPAKEAPGEVTDEELAQYSEAVQKRLKQFTRSYHDERRRAEAAEREREEAVNFAKQVAEQNKALQGQLSQGEKIFLEQAKKAAEAEMQKAEQDYQTAYESGDTKAAMAAMKQVNAAQITLDRITNYRPAQNTVQREENVVQPQQVQKPSVPKPDKRSLDWQADNPWFGEDEEMTSFALGFHEKLVNREGVDPRTPEYYERVNARMRQVFPDYFSETTSDTPPAQAEKRAASVVAPATRSTAPKKIRLTQTQVALAKKLGLSLEQYAKQVAALENRNG